MSTFLWQRVPSGVESPGVAVNRAGDGWDRLAERMDSERGIDWYITVIGGVGTAIRYCYCGLLRALNRWCAPGRYGQPPQHGVARWLYLYLGLGEWTDDRLSVGEWTGRGLGLGVVVGIAEYLLFQWVK